MSMIESMEHSHTITEGMWDDPLHRDSQQSENTIRSTGRGFDRATIFVECTKRASKQGLAGGEGGIKEVWKVRSIALFQKIRRQVLH